ncbi:TPA: hypothetical protein ACPUBN_001887, partial [Streptococcus pyogenes]
DGVGVSSEEAATEGSSLSGDGDGAAGSSGVDGVGVSSEEAATEGSSLSGDGDGAAGSSGVSGATGVSGDEVSSE